MQLSGKRKKRKIKGSKITFTKCFRLFTQHLSSSLCHSSGTKQLARQTMLLRQKRREKEQRGERERERNDTSKSASGEESSPEVSELGF